MISEQRLCAGHRQIFIPLCGGDEGLDVQSIWSLECGLVQGAMCGLDVRSSGFEVRGSRFGVRGSRFEVRSRALLRRVPTCQIESAMIGES